MKRPEETKYFQYHSAPKVVTERQQQKIEELIDKNIFLLPEDFGNLTTETSLWLCDYGWQVERKNNIDYLIPID